MTKVKRARTTKSNLLEQVSLDERFMHRVDKKKAKVKKNPIS